MQLHVSKRLSRTRTVPCRGRIARKYHRLALHIVKLLEVIPKSSTVVLFLIYHIIRNCSVD